MLSLPPPCVTRKHIPWLFHYTALQFPVLGYLITHISTTSITGTDHGNPLSDGVPRVGKLFLPPEVKVYQGRPYFHILYR